MPDKLVSGQKILEEYFDNLPEMPGIDGDVSAMLTTLYRDGRFSNVNISNELDRIRGEVLSGKPQAD